MIPLFAITALYIIIALVKPHLKWGKKICAICLATSLTWLTMLVLWFIDFPVSQIQISIMMGMSVAGIMYKLEKIYNEKKIRNFWFVRIVLIVPGIYFIENLLNENFNSALLIFLSSFFSIIIATIFFQDPQNESSTYKKLDDCC